MVLYCIKFILSKCIGSLVISIKQIINLNFQPPSPFVFLILHKNGLNKKCSSFVDLSAFKFHGPS